MWREENLCVLLTGVFHCFSIAAIKCHDQGILFRLEVPGGWESIMEEDSAASGWYSSRNRKLRAHLFKSKHEADREQQVGWDYKFPEPTLSDTLPPARLYYLKRSKQNPMCFQMPETMVCVCVCVHFSFKRSQWMQLEHPEKVKKLSHGLEIPFLGIYIMRLK